LTLSAREFPVPVAPSAQQLAQDLQLRESGRERGLDGHPSTNQPGLDNEEERVVDHCNQLYSERREAYHQERLELERKIIEARDPEAERRKAEGDVEQACAEMERVLAREDNELKRLTGVAQSATDDLNRFKREHGLVRNPDYPAKRLWHLVIIAGLLLVETLINGLFFGANVSGGLFGGLTYAAIISAVNVVLFGILLAVGVRLMFHRDPRRKFGGVLLVVAVGAVAILGNLFVGHYREALAEDYPPAPVPNDSLATTPAVTSPSPSPGGQVVTGTDAPDSPADCWVGPDEDDADQEALCLLAQGWFRLNGFQSYLLLLIGLAMCIGAAADWFKMDDPYPGYGKLHRKHAEALDELEDARYELLKELDGTHDEALRRQRGNFVDPLEAWKLNLRHLEKLRRAHDDLCSFADDLAASCQGALEIYRTANREARRMPDDPGYWSDPWLPAWQRPPAPDGSAQGPEAEARRLSEAANAELARREAKLRKQHDELRQLVKEHTKLNLRSTDLAASS